MILKGASAKNEFIVRAAKNMTLNPPATKEMLDTAGSVLGIELPLQYQEFMLFSNGAEGCIGKSSYAVIWPNKNLAQYNADYEVNKYNPGLIYFGSDAGGMVFAFDNRTDAAPIVTLPFVSIDLEDVEPCGDTFDEFIQIMHDAK